VGHPKKPHDHKQTLFVSEGGARADWIHFDDSRTPFTVTLGLLTVTLGLLTLHQAEASIKHFGCSWTIIQLDNYSVWTIILTWQTTRRRLTDQDVFRRSPRKKIILYQTSERCRYSWGSTYWMGFDDDWCLICGLDVTASSIIIKGVPLYLRITIECQITLRTSLCRVRPT